MSLFYNLEKKTLNKIKIVLFETKRLKIDYKWAPNDDRYSKINSQDNFNFSKYRNL
jgi:hypothetical protein